MEPRTSRMLEKRRRWDDKTTGGETRGVKGLRRRMGGWGRRKKTWKREMGWGARQRSRQRDGAVIKGVTVRPRKDRAAAPAYHFFHETSALISINSNDKCGPLWQRLINSRRGELTRARIQIIQCHRPEQVLRGSVLTSIVFRNDYQCSFVGFVSHHVFRIQVWFFFNIYIPFHALIQRYKAVFV